MHSVSRKTLWVKLMFVQGTIPKIILSCNKKVTVVACLRVTKKCFMRTRAQKFWTNLTRNVFSSSKQIPRSKFQLNKVYFPTFVSVTKKSQNPSFEKNKFFNKFELLSYEQRLSQRMIIHASEVVGSNSLLFQSQSMVPGDSLGSK